MYGRLTKLLKMVLSTINSKVLPIMVNTFVLIAAKMLWLATAQVMMLCLKLKRRMENIAWKTLEDINSILRRLLVIMLFILMLIGMLMLEAATNVMKRVNSFSKSNEGNGLKIL